ncbi:MAG: 50S ribosomal protein L11 methyltransferase [Candidatus Neomarinimicrobiota bacterium]
MSVNPESSTRWLKIAVPKGAYDLEMFTARLTQWGMLGLQEADDRFEIYFPLALKPALPELLADFFRNRPDIKPVITEIADDGWGYKWQEYFKPQIISPRITVRPFWEKPIRAVAIEIVLKPGMAFGTGTHATTHMALGLLEKYLRPGMNILDAGCGSGILTIAALKLGAARVAAWDIDPSVITNFDENLELNGITENYSLNIGDVTQLSVHRPSGEHSDRPNYDYDLIVSNIERQPNLKLLAALVRQEKRPLVIFTGLLKEEYELFKNAVLNYGREVLDNITEDEWIALVVK